MLALGLAAGQAQGATLVVATDRDPDSLDPALAYASESWQVLVNAGEGLVAYRRTGGTAGTEVVPALAAGDAGGERRRPPPDVHACAATRASGRRPTGRCAPATSRRAWSGSSWRARRGGRCSA